MIIDIDDAINFENDATFENFIGQFQAVCGKLLCIIDGKRLKIYETVKSIPVGLQFEYTKNVAGVKEYHFVDPGTKTTYCVFGDEAVKIFFPSVENSVSQEVSIIENGIKSSCWLKSYSVEVWLI